MWGGGCLHEIVDQEGDPGTCLPQKFLLDAFSCILGTFELYLQRCELYMHALLLAVLQSLTRVSYKDRFALLAESMEREKQDIGVREKAQTKVVYVLCSNVSER